MKFTLLKDVLGHRNIRIHETRPPLGKHVDMFQQISLFFKRLRIVLDFYGSVVGT